MLRDEINGAIKKHGVPQGKARRVRANLHVGCPHAASLPAGDAVILGRDGVISAKRCRGPAAACYNARVVLSLFLGSLSVLSAALLGWQWRVARRFPLHVRPPALAGTLPGVTVLKPLKGADSESAACLRSWFTQEYPGPVQLLFGVASEMDPICDLVREWMAAFPERDAQLLVCAERLGANAKVSKLLQLERHARHEILVVSDADVWAPRDLLAALVPALAEEQTGLVNCFYHLAHPTTLAMRWEAIAVNADFWSQVLQARSLKPLDFALGAVLALRRETLRAAGGFAPLADQLADDYQLGRRIARTGRRIELCPVVVECREAPQGFRDIWTHQLRWARTVRVCQPVPYFFSILGNATLWPLLWLGLCPGGVTLAVAGSLLLGRIIVALDLQRRCTRSPEANAYGWLVPVKDLLGAAIWALAFCGNQIVWRGERYRVGKNGVMK